jgi:hypothetical protein
MRLQSGTLDVESRESHLQRFQGGERANLGGNGPSESVAVVHDSVVIHTRVPSGQWVHRHPSSCGNVNAVVGPLTSSSAFSRKQHLQPTTMCVTRERCSHPAPSRHTIRGAGSCLHFGEGRAQAQLGRNGARQFRVVFDFAASVPGATH